MFHISIILIVQLMFLNHDAKIRLFHETTKLFLLNSAKILILIFLTNRPFVPRETFVATVPRETLFFMKV